MQIMQSTLKTNSLQVNLCCDLTLLSNVTIPLYFICVNYGEMNGIDRLALEYE